MNKLYDVHSVKFYNEILLLCSDVGKDTKHFM